MSGMPAYMVIGTIENVTNGDELSSQMDYYRAGLYLSPTAAEQALSKVKVPAKYMFISIVKITVQFYVCVSNELNDEDMADRSRSDSKFLPPILWGPFDSIDQAEMMRLLVDRHTWKGALVLAMTNDGARKTRRAE